MKFLLGKKIGMSQMFDEKGTMVPFTLIAAGPCFIIKKKSSLGQDKYDAVQFGFEKVEKINVSGISKGKGFQGGVKRHGFSGRDSSHGVKHEHRTIGSTGQRFPQHVIKGRKMPGRMGSDRITVKNLTIVK